VSTARHISYASRPRILFINRSYWPDVEASGQLLTELCEGLADRFDIQVLAGRPNNNAEGDRHRIWGPEVRNGVTILRVPHTRFSKHNLAGRAVNLLSFLTGAWLRAWRIKPPDVVITETDPFLLPLLGSWMKRRHRIKFVAYLQDLYPDIAVGLGKVKEGRLTKTIRSRLLRAYERTDSIIVLGSDMKCRLESHGVDSGKIRCLPNWIDSEQVYPVKQDNQFRERERLGHSFVVMHSGNMGLSQQLDNVLAASELLQDRSDIEFVLVGDGATRPGLMRAIESRGLTNVRILPYQPKSELAQSLSAADAHLICVHPGASSCLMPSKLYGVLASGTAAVAVAPLDSELCGIIREHEIGVAAPPGRPRLLADQIRFLADHPTETHDMGVRARHLAENEYDRSIAIARFSQLLDSLLPVDTHHAEKRRVDRAAQSSPLNPTADRTGSVTNQ